MILLNAAQSRELDRLSRDKYAVPSYALMTRAGEAVALALARRWPDAPGAGVLVVAGKGNNGGDGFVAARRLMRSGARVRVALLASVDELKDDAARACADFRTDGGTLAEVRDEAGIAAAMNPKPAALIDAIFGTGLNAPIAGVARAAIDAINECGAPVVAVDIASGVNADSGAIMGAAVRANQTVTFGYAKYGHVSYPGAARCGDLEVAEIGFAPNAIADIAPRGRFVEASDVRPLIRPRAAESHKGDYGHPLIIAGSTGKSGAAVLCARGALRMGAGLVTAAIPESVAAIVASQQAELMTEPMPSSSGGGFDAAAAIARLREVLKGKNAIVAGPGLGLTDETRRLIEFLITDCTAHDRPLLIDADGLNALAALGPSLVRKARGPVVLTPHPGEMARLLGCTNAEVNADRISAARTLADATGACVLLKGSRSVIVAPDGTVHVNSSGNPGMATPGMGDALSGMIGTLLGQGFAPLDALALGVFAHGYSADRLARRIGAVGYLAGDLIDDLPAALAALVGGER
jgi:hydroxyethylthiazole kinase-like uncharacterized protein yjeF